MGPRISNSLLRTHKSLKLAQMLRGLILLELLILLEFLFTSNRFYDTFLEPHEYTHVFSVSEHERGMTNFSE